MHKKLFTVILVALIASGMMFAQDAKKAPVKLDQPTVSVESVQHAGGPAPVTAANYVEVDVMPNVYGPAIGALNPAAYDPYSNTAIVVHRGATTVQGYYAAGSGELWYNYSTDLGATWNRSADGVNSQNSQILARYPSAAIANPGMSEDRAEAIAVFAWPELDATAGGFQHVGYAADLSFDGADFAAISDDGATTSTPLYSSQVPIFTHTGSDGETGYVFWMSDNTDDASIRIWRTTDYSDVVEIDPPTWSSASFGDNGNITMGGVSHNGVAYYGVIASFAEGFVGPGGWGIGYSKSEDDGDTWSAWNTVDWTAISTTDKYTELWDYKKGDEFISYQGDINVDKYGYVHIVTGLTIIDTNVSAEFGENGLIEFFETGDGWDAKVIVSGESLTDSTYSQYDGVALGQMGPSVYLAFDADREFMMAQWVTHDGPASDSFFCDVYASYRMIGENNWSEWSEPMNLTETPGMNENGSHFAPTLHKSEEVNGEITTLTYTGLSFYYYPLGVTYGAGVPLTNPTAYYAAPVAVSIDTGTVSVKDGLSEFSYELGQNYPNPFNPSTSIKYDIAKTSNVTLKVYDVLGAEVATLVNKVQNPGSYNVNFNASNLSSGVYIYEIKAGDFVKSAKMMLMK